jgi:predicted DNA-binding protein (UPF0251 family)
VKLAIIADSGIFILVYFNGFKNGKQKIIAMARPKKIRRVSGYPNSFSFVPAGRWKPRGEITLPVEGYEAIRLNDYEGLRQKNAASKMGISRATFSRILKEARKNIAEAIISGKTLKIKDGSYAFEVLADSIILHDE